MCVIGVAVWWGVMGCGAPDGGDAPEPSGEQATWRNHLTGPWREVVVLVVDDGADESARQLRAAVLDGVRSLDDRYSRDCCGGPDDPAHWDPVDRRAVVVRPSAIGDQRLAGPHTHPGLVWREQRRTAPEEEAWIEAVGAALNEFEAPEGAAYPLLQAMTEAVQLVARARAPATAAERELLETLPAEGVGVFVVVATTRDDQSPREPAEYLLDGRMEAARFPEPEPVYVYADGVIVPTAEQNAGGTCRVRDSWTTTPRLAEWIEADGAGGRDPASWPCDHEEALFPRLYVDPAPRCLEHAVSVDRNGRADCRIVVQTSSANPCPAELGWLDPQDATGTRRGLLQSTPFVDRAVRVCEISQLDGSALESCRTSEDCATCSPGWCLTTIWNAAAAGRCPAGWHPGGFRFAGGAAEGQAGELTITCDSELD